MGGDQFLVNPLQFEKIQNLKSGIQKIDPRIVKSAYGKSGARSHRPVSICCRDPAGMLAVYIRNFYCEIFHNVTWLSGAGMVGAVSRLDHKTNLFDMS